MALTWTWRRTGEKLHVSLAAGTLTLSFDGHINLSFDGEGRLVGAWYAGRTYRRSLDNRVLLKWLEPEQRAAAAVFSPQTRRATSYPAPMLTLPASGVP